MKKKYYFLLLLGLFTMSSSTKTFAFEHIDNINDGISVYFLVQLDSPDYLELNITHMSEGNFTLFLFDFRPIESFVKPDKSLDHRIYEQAINFSLEDTPYIYHNISESKIYYIQLILVNNGPDTFLLYSNKELTRYYLPIIPGYSIGLIFISMMIIISLIVIFRKRKIHCT